MHEVLSVISLPGTVDVNKKRRHLLVGDSTIRGVDLGQHVDVLKEVRCLLGARKPTCLGNPFITSKCTNRDMERGCPIGTTFLMFFQ